jgi:hypothetical protein
MKQITFSGKISSLHLDNDQEFSEVVLKNVSFTLHKGSLDDLDEAILFEKHFLVTLEEMKRI